MIVLFFFEIWIDKMDNKHLYMLATALATSAILQGYEPIDFSFTALCYRTVDVGCISIPLYFGFKYLSDTFFATPKLFHQGVGDAQNGFVMKDYKAPRGLNLEP
jgi:hypothetical protein